MRNLQFQDVFKVIRILKKAGLSKQARIMMIKAAEKQKDDKIAIDVKELGIDFIFTILENLGDAEDEVYSFFADLTRKEVDVIKKQELDEMVGMFESFLKIPNLNSFLPKVLSMMK